MIGSESRNFGEALAGNWLEMNASLTYLAGLYTLNCIYVFFTGELKSERSVGSLELTGNFTLSSISSDYCSKEDIITLGSIRRLKFSV